MTEFIAQNPLISLLLAMAAVVSSAWKLFHELYVKPRDLRIEYLREELGRLEARFEAGAISQGSALSLPPSGVAVHAARLQSDPLNASSGKPVGGRSEERFERFPEDDPGSHEGDAIKPKQPTSSLATFYSAWKAAGQTDLQRQHFEKSMRGVDVSWRGLKVESVSAAMHGRVFVWVSDPSYLGGSLFGGQACAFFPDGMAEQLVQLGKGALVDLDGKVDSFLISPAINGISLKPSSKV